MADTQDLSGLLADLTTRQEQIPSSRNRPINLYSMNNETVNLAEAFTSTTRTPPFKWSDGVSADRLIWGEGQWS